MLVREAINTENRPGWRLSESPISNFQYLLCPQCGTHHQNLAVIKRSVATVAYVSLCKALHNDTYV